MDYRLTEPISRVSWRRDAIDRSCHLLQKLVNSPSGMVEPLRVNFKIFRRPCPLEIILRHKLVRRGTQHSGDLLTFKPKIRREVGQLIPSVGVVVYTHLHPWVHAWPDQT